MLHALHKMWSMRYEKRTYFKDYSNWVNVIIIACNTIFGFMMWRNEVIVQNDDIWSNGTRLIRVLECTSLVLIAVKITYFLSLVDKIAPLIDII